MKHPTRRAHLLSQILLLVGLTSFITIDLAAQTAEHAPGSGIPRGRDTTGRTPDNLRPPSIRERQMVMRQMEAEAATPRTPEEERLALEQIADDYSKIQIINNKMMGVTIPSKAPDYKYIGETVSEIKKRADRLKLNLRLPKAEKGPETKYVQPTDLPTLKNALLSLDKAIMSFVGNSIFKNPDVFDVKAANQLGLDLDTIIEFTKALDRDVEKLGKASAKTN
jgi:hypothetical protein